MSPDNRIKLIKGLEKLLLLFNVLFRSLFSSLFNTLDTLCRPIYDIVHTRHDDRYKLNECCCYNFSASSPCRVCAVVLLGVLIEEKSVHNLASTHFD